MSSSRRSLEDNSIHPEDKKRARLRSLILLDIQEVLGLALENAPAAPEPKPAAPPASGMPKAPEGPLDLRTAQLCLKAMKENGTSREPQDRDPDQAGRAQRPQNHRAVPR